ncbi:hypothetical protein [Phenylobacterium sp.]|uniref:hypothetical protein n=1 Tax=Phenylobacterium sp. TaxID=1871053 RepID=UPI00261FC20A|nr:hypothetical protein [Phenylobacterium sp.]
MLISILAVGTVLLADASAATAPSPPAKVQKAADRPKPVCHLETRPGSHMSQRVCLTAAQAAEREQETKEAVESVQRRGTPERHAPGQ